MTSITTGILQVVWSANRSRPVGEGTTAQLTMSGDLMLKSVDDMAVCSVGTMGWSVTGVSVGTDGNLVLLEIRRHGCLLSVLVLLRR
jgi:hypothetical protein